MSRDSVLRVGIVGCGNQGYALAEAVGRTKSLRVVACADPNKAAANRTATRVGEATTHDSIEALLAESEVDVVLLATPHHVLAPAALAAIRAGKHVMAEKPIGLNAQEAVEIEESANQAKVCFMPGYSFRFYLGRYVQELLAAGAVGEIVAVSGSIGFPPRDSGWVAFSETGGGPLLYVGSHLVDMMLWYLKDDPESVFADVRRRADTGADETSTFQIRFKGGAMAQGCVTQAASSFFYTLDIQGRAGRITLRGWNFLQFELEVSSTALAAYAQPTIIRPRIMQDAITMMFVPELEEFASAIREERPPIISVREARQVLKVLDAIVEAGQRKELVRL